MDRKNYIYIIGNQGHSIFYINTIPGFHNLKFSFINDGLNIADSW